MKNSPVIPQKVSPEHQGRVINVEKFKSDIAALRKMMQVDPDRYQLPKKE